jgi:hypothetical protein
MMRRGVAAVLLCVGALTVSPAAAQTLQVTPLPRDGQVLVSFKLSDAFTEEVLAAIHSGMTISFVYDVDLKRASAVWVDRTIASASVTAAVRYDNLTRRYQLTRMLDGRIERADTTEREEEVRAWLTADFDKLQLFSRAPLEANGEYYVRVRVHTTPGTASFVWPWMRSGVTSLAKFTFIQ